jgi:O-antigen/teichoic acid export membrane protein
MNTKVMSGVAGTVRSRLIRGFGATALGPVVTAIVQIVSVPVFLHFWGAKMYGEWLILSAIPSYLMMSDFGFGSVAGNDMTMRVAAGDRDGALETFQSTWALILTTSALIGLLVLSAIWFLPLTRWLNISSIGVTEVRLILVLFSVDMLFVVQTSLITAGFRCEGNYAYGVLLTNMMRLAEFTITVCFVALGARPLRVVAALLTIRVLGTLVMTWRMFRKSPWLHFGVQHARLVSIRRLASPAFAFLAFPAGNALSTQGMVVVIGVVLGPIAVTVFSTLRTLTRFSFQIITVVAATIWPELSAAYGAQQWPVARKLHRYACQASLYFSMFSSTALLFCGEWIVRIWTHGHVIFDPTLFRLLLLVIIANSFWYTSSVVPIAANRHEKVALFYLLGGAGSLGFAYLLLLHFGLAGGALALLFFDLVTGIYTLRQSLSMLDDSFGEFARAVFTPHVFSVSHLRLAFRR